MSVGSGQKQISGKNESGNEELAANRAMAAQVKKDYESHAFVLPNGSNDVNIKTALAVTAFDKIVRAHHILVRSDATISFKLNSAGEDPITVDADIPFPLSLVEFNALFLTNNSGGAATMEIQLV